jgi:hypothetical protein
MNTFKHIFFWLAGAGSETLERCPNWEQRKYVALGATVLVPCAFAFIACSYALSTVTERTEVIYSVATVWAFIILSIDRALISGYRAYLSFSRKLSQFALRIVVAALLGVTIAHPVVLMLFRDTIHTLIENDRAEEIDAARVGFEERKVRVRGEIDGLERALAEQREKWNESFQAKFLVQQSEDADVSIPGLSAAQQEELGRAIAEATRPFDERLKKADAQLAELTPQFTTLQTELGFWQTEFEREINGQRSGLVGEGPRARSIRYDQLQPRREESRRLSGLLEHLTQEKTNLQTMIREAEAAAIAAFETSLAEIELRNQAESERVAELRRQVETDQAGQFVEQQNALRETIRQQIDTRLRELERSQEELAMIGSEEATRIQAIRDEPRRDILTQTLALHGLFITGGEGGKFAFYTYIILTMLFMLVDTIPLVIKFFIKPGPYDSLVDRDEVSFESEHKAFLESNRRYMAQLSAGNLITVTRNKNLEHALLDGVEHTRAAREFLDSLIDMERSFSEQMKAQEALTAYEDGDKRKAFATMRQRFYDDLHHRMETFFAPRQA